jgi:hypothetical protein
VFKNIHITTGDYSYIVEDLIIALAASFDTLGYNVTVELNSLRNDAVNLNIAATGIRPEDFASNSDRLIHYNLEQIRPGNYQITHKSFLDTLRMGFVWDYSEQNIEELYLAGLTNVFYVPIGYNDAMTRIESADDLDIDVLFYGYETERRVAVLNQIRDKGLNVVTSEILQPQNKPWQNAYRNEMIARSKVVLNTHAFESNNIFELVRVSHLLANKKAVVAEVTEHTQIDRELCSAVMHGTMDQLPSLCEALVKNEVARKVQEFAGFEIFKQRRQTEYVYNGLGAYCKWRGLF